MAAHAGYGKLILFGEHFVVYKAPAVVAAVTAATTCTVTRKDTPGWTQDDNRPAVPGYKVEKKEEQDQATELVLKHLGIDTNKTGIHITLGGDLEAVSGIGASAANCVALARACSEVFNLNLSEEQINQAAYEGEKGYHGTPSGVDNTASTYGGILKFQRTDSSPIFSRLQLGKEIEVVYASTGIVSSTTTVVGDVRKRKEADPVWFDELMQQYQKLYDAALIALENGMFVVTVHGANTIIADWATLGQLMDKNHSLCQQLTVSCTELDHLVQVSRDAGAIGAKMSGTGRGGLMIALTPGAELQDKVAQALRAAGAPQVWKSTIRPNTTQL